MTIFLIYRSRTHTLRTQGIEPLADDEISLGSDQEQDQDLNTNSNSVNLDMTTSTSRTASPMMDGERVLSPFSIQQQHQQHYQMHNQLQLQEKPYKPKFHNVLGNNQNAIKEDNRGQAIPSTSTGRLNSNATTNAMVNFKPKLTL